MQPRLTLLKKELDQHRTLMLVVAAVLLGTLILVWWALTLTSSAVSELRVLSLFAIVPVPLAAALLGHRLISTEYYARTQLFVEALPIKPGQMEWIKFLLGLAFLTFIMAMALALMIAIAADRLVLTPRFVGIMLARLLVFGLALWSVVFLVSFLGRLRLPLVVASILVVSYVRINTEFEFDRFGPLALIDAQTLGFERHAIPWRALLESIIVGIVATLAAFTIARFREGSVSETLTKAMSQREKGFSALLLLGGIAAFATLDEERMAEPFQFNTRYVVSSDDGTVEVAYLIDDHYQKAQELATYLEGTGRFLADLADWPAYNYPVRVTLDPTAPVDEVTTTRINERDGIVLGTNFAAAGWSREWFGAHAIHSAITLHTGSRALLDPKHWWADGLSLLVAYHDRWAEGQPTEDVDPLMLQALVATRTAAVDVQTFRDWEITTQQLGERLALALAYSGFQVLLDRRGIEGVRALAKTVLDTPNHGDVRDWWYERQHPIDVAFEDAVGENWAQFVDHWRDHLAQLERQGAYRSVLDAIPQMTVTITGDVTDDGSRSILFKVDASPPPPPDTVCRFLHRTLPAFPVAVSTDGLNRVERRWPQTQPQLSTRIDNAYGAGQRVIAIVDCDVSPLDSPLRVGVQRLTMP